jgi:hypothetical protein
MTALFSATPSTVGKSSEDLSSSDNIKALTNKGDTLSDITYPIMYQIDGGGNEVTSINPENLSCNNTLSIVISSISD